MTRMIATALALLLAVPAAPAAAQEGESEIAEGLDMLSEGARRFLRGLGEEAAPLLRGLSEDVEPMLTELFRLIDDFSAYELPEKLPNGDIIIRRDKPVQPPAPEQEEAPQDAPADGPVEL